MQLHLSSQKRIHATGRVTLGSKLRSSRLERGLAGRDADRSCRPGSNHPLFPEGTVRCRNCDFRRTLPVQNLDIPRAGRVGVHGWVAVRSKAASRMFFSIRQNYFSLESRTCPYPQSQRNETSGKPTYQGRRILASIRPEMQAAGKQCLKLLIAVAFPDPQTAHYRIFCSRGGQQRPPSSPQLAQGHSIFLAFYSEDPSYAPQPPPPRRAWFAKSFVQIIVQFQFGKFPDILGMKRVCRDKKAAVY